MDTLEIRLEHPDLSDAQIQSRLLMLSKELEARAEVETTMPRGDAQPGTKGEPVTIGLLLLTFMTSGAAVAALGVIKDMFGKDKSVVIVTKTADGTERTITATNIDDLDPLFGQSGQT